MMCVILCVMKSATIREVQHNLTKVLREVEAGKTVEIIRRKQPVARLIPLALSAHAPLLTDWDDHGARMDLVWEGSVVEGVDEVLGDLRGGR